MNVVGDGAEAVSDDPAVIVLHERIGGVLEKGVFARERVYREKISAGEVRGDGVTERSCNDQPLPLRSLTQ